MTKKEWEKEVLNVPDVRIKQTFDFSNHPEIDLDRLDMDVTIPASAIIPRPFMPEED